ncbi:hypothetical protein BJX61DRAFT_466731 [Aspergillus egyptiacus]|nr:hypothetical protein BJX61DRAFT_466731 [Aspergillus egyptiacus]
MSFLDSVLSSIETGKPTPIPTTSPAPPSVPSSQAKPAKPEIRKPEIRKPTPTARPVPVERKNEVTTGTKRKAEEPLPRIQKPGAQVPVRPAPTKPAATAATLNARASSKPANPSTSSNGATSRKTPPASSKPPVKGSFKEIMEQAKALQQTAPTQVGMFKHQPVPKEKLSKAERKKRFMEAQLKEKDAKLGKKAGGSSTASTTSRLDGGKTTLRRGQDEPTYKGTARPSYQPEYRGTAGLPSRNGDRKPQFKSTKRSRMDEYLGTDEEDEGEFADDYDDYYSESSDMEAGLDDVEQEEARALAAARREDEEDIRREAAAKQAKLERRKKLAMLASKK